MRKLRPLFALTLALTLATSSIYGQAPYCQEDENCGCAYEESSHTAHWSVYIPIAIIVGAAIWFGLADRHHEHHHSSKDSQDGLGSITNSKRHSSSYSYGSYSSSYSGDSYRPRSSSYRPGSHLSSSFRTKKSFSGSHSH